MRICLALCLAFLWCSCGSPLGIRAHAGYMSLEPGGDAALEDAAKTGNLDALAADLESDFNLDRGETPYVRLDLDTSGWSFELSGFQYEDSSGSTLTKRFGDIPVGTPVDTELTVTNIKLAVLKDIIDTDVAELSAGLALNYFDVDMDVRSLIPQVAPNTIFENTDFEAPVPMLYLRGAVDVWVLRGELSLGWMSIDLGDAKGKFFDVDAMVSAKISMIDVFAGYRYISLDSDGEVDGQAFETDTQLSGWYLGGGIRF